MATPGTNMTARGHEKIKYRINQVLGLTPNERITQTMLSDTPTAMPRTIAFLSKHGAPATNTAADAPTGIGDLCYDDANKRVYRCSAYTNTTTFTWTQIAP